MILFLNFDFKPPSPSDSLVIVKFFSFSGDEATSDSCEWLAVSFSMESVLFSIGGGVLSIEESGVISSGTGILGSA